MSRPVTYRRSRSPEAASGPTERPDAGLGASAWTIPDALTVAAVLLTTLVVNEMVLSSRLVSVMPVSGRIATRAVVLTAFYAIQVWTLVVLTRRHGHGFTDAFAMRVKLSTGGVLSASLLVCVLLFATRMAATGWGLIASAIGWTPPETGTLKQLFGSGGLGLGLALMLVVLVAPLVEELCFRGVITRALAARMPAPAAIVVGSAVFSAYHLTAWVMVPTFILGCALGWVALTRPTIWPAVALHALYNGVVVAAAYFVQA